MSAVKPAIPWLVDPIGGIVHAATGFDKSPFGVANKVVNPPRPKIPAPQDRPAPKPPGAPQVSFTQGPAPKMPAPVGPQVPAAVPQTIGKEPAGGGAGADVTKGLLRKPSAGRTLLS